MSGDAARAFITLISVCPPASARAPSFDASSSSASRHGPGLCVFDLAQQHAADPIQR